MTTANFATFACLFTFFSTTAAFQRVSSVSSQDLYLSFETDFRQHKSRIRVKMTLVKDKPDSEYFEWSPEDEIQLFFAMEGLRPVGINRHFAIACITERLAKALNRDVTSDMVWAHLKTMYNLKVLEEQEQLALPNEESDFSLPETEFSSVMKRKSIEEPIVTEESKKTEPKPEPAVKSGKLHSSGIF